MKILITGVTETHNNHPQRASSTKFVSIPELMREAYLGLGHEVDHCSTKNLGDLSLYDKVFLYAYPLDKNAMDVSSAQRVLRERMDAYICLDDWSFQNILPTWESIISKEDLADHQWIAPLFPWGDIAKMQLPVDVIYAWDPSPFYEMPPCHHHAWQKRKSEWYNASLSKASHEWAAAQNLNWPIYSVGGKSLGQPRILESDVVWQYGFYKGVLCPTYTHAGCGWWRVRYLHAAFAGAVLGGDPKELSVIDAAYQYTLKELENMDDDRLLLLASEQYVALVDRIATKSQSLSKLESFLK